MQTAEQRLDSLGLELPPPPKAMGLYQPAVVVDRMLTTSGHGPLLPEGKLVQGRLGDDLTTEQGYQAARLTGLAVLSTVRAACGSLDRVERLVKTLGLVQCVPGFTDQPAVVNGFSELMREVFGDQAGVGARSAVGVAALPAGMAVEVEVAFLLKP